MSEPTRGQLVWLSCAAVLVGGSLAGIDHGAIDFRDFYESAAAWWRGDPLYTRENLNPPTFVLLSAPLGLLPYHAAHRIWLLVSASLVAVTVWRTVRERALSTAQAIWLVGATGAITPGWMPWQLGQVTWLLFALVTAAWLAARQQRLRSAGVWLGLAIALKPPLAVAALLLPWSILWVSAATAGATTVGAILTTGWEPWWAWLTLGARIDWLGQPLNASLWSVVGRMEAGDISGIRLADLGWPWWCGVGVAALALIGRTRQISGDTPSDATRWTLAILVSILVSPLGWAYYVPLAYVPAIASWRQKGWWSVALYAIPMPILWRIVGGNLLLAHLIGAVYPGATLWAWIVWSTRAPGGVKDGDRLTCPAPRRAHARVGRVGHPTRSSERSKRVHSRIFSSSRSIPGRARRSSRSRNHARASCRTLAPTR